MKKFLTLLCSICLILPFTFILSGCKEPQITMMQIEEAVENCDFSTFEDVDITRIDGPGSGKEAWENNLERQNIDTTYFKLYESYCAYYNQEGINFQEAYFYVLKFSTSGSASACKDYQLEEGTEMKIYGNLVIICDEVISEFIFGVIDAIEPK